MEERVCQLRKQGWSYKKIAEKMKVCKDTVIRILRPEQYKAKVAKNKRRRLITRERAIQFLGGKCKKCGYNKCSAAMDFHHIDPKTKEMDLSKAFTKLRRSFDSLIPELKKCELLCCRCHRELHNC